MENKDVEKELKSKMKECLKSLKDISATNLYVIVFFSSILLYFIFDLNLILVFFILSSAILVKVIDIDADLLDVHELVESMDKRIQELEKRIIKT